MNIIREIKKKKNNSFSSFLFVLLVIFFTRTSRIFLSIASRIFISVISRIFIFLSIVSRIFVFLFIISTISIHSNYLLLVLWTKKLNKFIIYSGDYMEIIGPLLISTIAGLSTILGSLIIFLKLQEKHINRFITFCLSFSLAIMIGISITDLIPESTYIIISNYKLFKGLLICLITFIVGIILILWINKKITREEWGTKDLYKLGILNMIALMLHNLPEGIATFMSSYKDINLGIKLSLAIMLHNIPEGISIAVPIYYATGSKREAIKKTFISGLAEPLGALLAFIFLHKYITYKLISIVLIFVAGIMITLAIDELLPQALKYKENKYIILGLIIGLIVIVINLML